MDNESSTPSGTTISYEQELEERIRLHEVLKRILEDDCKNFKAEASSNGERVLELEAELNSEKSKSRVYQRELRELKAEATSNGKRVSKLEEELNGEKSKSSEYQRELRELSEKSAEHDRRANTIHQRSVELEDLVRTSDSKAVNAEKKVSELEVLVETEKYRIKELEEQISLLEKNCDNFKAEASSNGTRASELEAELEVVQLRASSLEVALQASKVKEKELNELLNVASEENKRINDAIKASNETFQSSKKDLQTMIVHLEEQLKEQKSNEDALKTKLEILDSEIGQKAELQKHMKEIEEKLATTEARFKEEKDSSFHKDLEREAALKHSSEELEVKKKEILVLENRVKDLEQKLQLGNAKSKKKDVGGATEPKGRRYKISENRLFNFVRKKE